MQHASVSTDDFPETITEDEYKTVRDNKDSYPDWYVGLVGFCATFSGKWFGGYARGHKEDGTPRDIPNESIRNLIKQAPSLKGIEFSCKSYLELTNVYNSVIYCDIPYKGTLKYSSDKFDYEQFYNWCRRMSEHNIILVSEYQMPDDFECIWQKDVKVSIDRNRISGDLGNVRTEKLFIYCNY